MLPGITSRCESCPKIIAHQFENIIDLRKQTHEQRDNAVSLPPEHTVSQSEALHICSVLFCVTCTLFTCKLCMLQDLLSVTWLFFHCDVSEMKALPCVSLI